MDRHTVEGGVIGGVTTVVAAKTLIPLVGFGVAGVGKGTIAAGIMSYCGPISSGSMYAILQSAGVIGLPICGTILVAGVGVAAGVAVVSKLKK